MGRISVWIAILGDRMATLRDLWPAIFMSCLAIGLAARSAFAESRDIVLPVDVTHVADRIAIEIDGTDVTEFIRIEAGQILVTVHAALGPGPHIATIYVAEGNGYRVFATYRFEVAAEAAPGLTVALEAEHEVGVTHDGAGTEGLVASNGTLTAEAPDQSIIGQLTYVADTREENQVAGRFADIAQYSVELRQSGPLLDLTGRVGHQSLGFDPALVSDLNRRGLSVEGAGPAERLQFHLFALKAGAAQGGENILGIASVDDRMLGGRLAFRPFPGSDLRVSLQGYEGRGAPDFALIPGEGSGGGGALDGTALGGRLRYGLTWAGTRWDGDGPGLLPRDEGEALLATIAFDADAGAGRSLTLGMAYEKVDLFYYSLANPGLATGGETLRFTTDYTAERLTLYGTLETTLTNQGGDPLDPVDRVNRLALDGTWAIYEAGALSGSTLTFGVSHEDLRREETPPAAPPPEDWSGTTAYLGLEKYGERAGWSLVYTYLNETDDGPGNFDLGGHEVLATLDLSPSDRLTIATTALAGRYNSAFSGRYDRFDGDFGLEYALEPELWALNIDLGLSATTEPGVEDGAYAAASVTRYFQNGSELALHAGWYEGSYTQTAGPPEETIVSMTYRLRSGMLR